MATVADLARRTLQRLGIALVTPAAAEAPMTLAEMAAAAVRQAGGGPIAAANIPAQTATLDSSALVQPVLQRLGVISGIETGSDDDRLAASEKIKRVHSLVFGQGLASWTLETIPNYAAESYIIMSAELLAPTFGKATDFQAYAMAEGKVQLMALRRGSGQTIGEEKIRSTHAMLAGLGLVDYSLTATPRSMAGVYIDAAAASLAPLFGGQAIPDAVPRAEAMARRAAMAREPGQKLAEEAVRATHRQLAAEGMTRWVLQDLPSWAEEPYVTIASTILAPRALMPVDMVAMEMARRDLRRVTMLRSAGEPVRREYF